MSITNKTFQLCFFSAFLTAMLVAGCAKPADEPSTMVKETGPPVELAKHAVEEVAPPHQLVGVWMGRGAISQNSLAIAIDGLSAETQQRVTAAAESFLATEMAVEFKANGQMESAVEVINKMGQRESGIGIATWEASPTINRGEFRVTSVEKQPNGSSATDYKTYRVSDDGQTLILLVDLQGLLGQCNPHIVMQRQDVETVASNPGLELR